MIGRAIAAAALIYCAAPARAADFANGLELLVACSPAETSPQAVFDACIDAIIVRVSELSGRGSNCPKIKTRDDIGWWVVNGREAMLGYWTKIGTPAEAARLSPQATLDAPLRIMGYGACIDSTAS